MHADLSSQARSPLLLYVAKETNTNSCYFFLVKQEEGEGLMSVAGRNIRAEHANPAKRPRPDPDWLLGETVAFGRNEHSLSHRHGQWRRALGRCRHNHKLARNTKAFSMRNYYSQVLLPAHFE